MDDTYRGCGYVLMWLYHLITKLNILSGNVIWNRWLCIFRYCHYFCVSFDTAIIFVYLSILPLFLCTYHCCVYQLKWAIAVFWFHHHARFYVKWFYWYFYISSYLVMLYLNTVINGGNLITFCSLEQLIIVANI